MKRRDICTHQKQECSDPGHGHDSIPGGLVGYASIGGFSTTAQEE